MCERRDKARFHLSGSRRFGHHSQRADAVSDLGPRVWIKNVMNRLHLAVLTASSTLLTQRVLVTPFLPDPNIFPWLCWEQILERGRRKYGCFVWFTITVSEPD